MVADLTLYGDSDKVREQNVKAMLDSLFFQLSFDVMVKAFELKNPSKEVVARLKAIMVSHLEQTTDVLIQVLSQVYAAEDK